MKSRRGGHIRYREAKIHARVLAIVGWLLIIVFQVGCTDRSLFGPLKWADFVHFYTLGDIARHRDTSLLFDLTSQHARQAALVPSSADDGFIPVYGPQTALLFAPLSLLPYWTAGLTWAVLTLTVYAWATWLAWRPARHVLRDREFVVMAALAFPPLFRLVGYGQTTAVVLLAFAGGWWAYRTDRRLLAGAVLSLLSVKPQFGLVLAPLAVLLGEGRLILGVLLGVGLQAVAVLALFGATALIDYGAVLRRLPAFTHLLEPRRYEMHSLASLTQLLPGTVSTVVWATLSCIVVAAAVLVWRKVDSSRVRFGALVLASTLVNPHLSVYDATVLGLPILWIGGWLLERQDDTTWFWQRVYFISAALFIPTAILIKIQLSPLLVAELFARIVLLTRSGQRHPEEKRTREDALCTVNRLV